MQNKIITLVKRWAVRNPFKFVLYLYLMFNVFFGILFWTFIGIIIFYIVKHFNL